MRLWLRTPLLLAWLATGFVIAATITVARGRVAVEPLMRWWCRGLLKVFGVRVRRRGAPDPRAGLVVANHVSWLDIAVLASARPTPFVAKSEVRDWPVVGLLARAGGTFFIQRGKGGAALATRLGAHLQRGGAVTLFPEGTTTDGAGVLPFHPRLFAAAVDSGAAVQPVALCYRPAAGGSNAAAFIGDDALVPHVVRMLRQRRTDVTVEYRATLPSRGCERDVLACACQSEIADAVRDVMAGPFGRRGQPAPVADVQITRAPAG